MLTTVLVTNVLQARRSAVAVRAQQDFDTTTSPDVDKLVKDLQDKVRLQQQVLLRAF